MVSQSPMKVIEDGWYIFLIGGLNQEFDFF